MNILKFGFQIFLISIFVNILLGSYLGFTRSWGFIIFSGLLLFNLIFNGMVINSNFNNEEKRTTIQKFLLSLALFFASTFPLVPLCIFVILNYRPIIIVWVVLPLTFSSFGLLFEKWIRDQRKQLTH